MASQIEPHEPDLEGLRAQAVVQGDATVLAAINQNTELLQQLFDRLQQNSGLLEPEEAFDEFRSLGLRSVDEKAIDAVDENIRLREENSRLNRLINELEAEIASLSEQRCDSGGPVVSEPVHSEVPPSPVVTQNPADANAADADPADEGELTWEQRKQLIIEQLENDSFDAEAFIETLDVPSEDEYHERNASDATRIAIDYVRDLFTEVEQLRQSLRESEIRAECDREEISALQESVQRLEDAPMESTAEASPAAPSDPPVETRDEQDDLQTPSMPVDPAEALLDADETIRQERERLDRLQQECEQKVRDIEIEASLERAKFSRERTQWEQKTSELEAQVNALQRSAGMKEDGSVGTRWMAKLGLTKDADQ